MKPYLLAAVILLFAINKGICQTASIESSYNRSSSSEAMAAELSQTMASELGLNQRQSVIVEAINLEGYQKLDEINGSKAVNARLIEKQVKRIERTRDYKLRAALTHKQWVAYVRFSKGRERLSKATNLHRKPEKQCAESGLRSQE